MNAVTHTVERTTWTAGENLLDSDEVVTETAVALVYNGVSHVVMMSTPADLEDLALGFSLSEGILDDSQQLLDCELQERANGLELAMTITGERFALLKQRRRNLTGRTGCGLCGLESLEQAVPEPALVVSDFELGHLALDRAVTGLGHCQSLKRLTGGVHGAAWCNPAGDIELLREDVGRHNALDKLLGALHGMKFGKEHGNQYSESGFVLVTSRASYEMVAKAASCNIPILAAVSAPTSLAISQAEQAGITLVGFVQPGRHVIYSHPRRIVEGS
jgi:FdhD protein